MVNEVKVETTYPIRTAYISRDNTKIIALSMAIRSGCAPESEYWVEMYDFITRKPIF